jgi:Zn-dependent protease
MKEPLKSSLPSLDDSKDGSGTSYYYESTYGQPFEFRRRMRRSSSTEVLHLLIATGLLALLSLSIVLNFPFIDLPAFSMEEFLFLFAILFLSFLPHELMHKIVAQRYGMFAEFRIIPYYALLTLVMLFAGLRLFAVGAVMIGGGTTIRAYGRTAAAGPATNLVIGVAMLGLAFVFPGLSLYLFFGVFFCGWIALFNMIPIGPLDGAKVLHWSKTAFAALLAGSVCLFIVGIVF